MIRRKIQGKKTFILGILLCVVVFLFASHKTPRLQLLFVLLFVIYIIVFLVNLITALTRLKTIGAWALVPVGISVLFFLLLHPAAHLGWKARMQKFQTQRPKYEKIISLIEKGEISVGHKLVRVNLPNGYKHLAYSVLADKDTREVLTVEFLSEGGFPVKYSGFLYRGDDNPLEWSHINRWPKVRKIEPKWYRISD